MTRTDSPTLPQTANACDANDKRSLGTHLPGILTSASLLQGQSAIAIEHNGSLYRLQATKQGKLILTK